MKKTLPVLLAAVSPLLADPCCETLQEPHCYPYAVNPPLICSPCWTWGGRLDFLYWRPSVENNEFAQVISNSVTIRSPSPNGNYSLALKDFNYDYDGGFRLGIAVGLPQNEWRLNVDWTHYLHTSHGSTFTNDPLTVALGSYFNFGTFSFIEAGVTFGQTSVNANWKIQLDLIDLVCNREFHVGHKVTLMPYGGLQILLLKQKVHTSNSIASFLGGEPLATQTSLATSSSDFKGVGIEAGLLSSWEFLCNLSFYGDISASALYGKNKSNLTGNGTTPARNAPPTSGFTADVTQNRNQIKALLDLSFGLQWREYFCQQSVMLTLRAGWEQQIYFRQNTLPSLSFDQALFNVNLSKPAGDISLQGLVVSANLTY